MRTLFILGLLAFAGNLLATALPNLKVSLSGTVLADAAEPLEYATISAFTTDSLLLDGTVTDAEGKFSLSLPKGGYLLKVEFIGFEPLEIDVELQSSKDLGVINLSSGGVMLDAVNVQAERTQMSLQLDKKVFNVGKDALAAGGSANEILEQIPSVAVSPDGTVSLRGNSGVTILINGRPSSLAENNGLAGLPAGSIESVEVITNPSAKYEAAGTAGILNIILKKEQSRGYGGTINIGTGFPDNHTLGVNLNFRSKKLNAFANVGGRYSNYNGSGLLTRSTSLSETAANLRQTTDQARNDLAGNGYFGLDYNLSDSEVLTAAYSIYHMRNDDEAVIDYRYSDSQGTPSQNFQQTTDWLEPGTYHQADLTYSKKYDTKGRKLTVYLRNDSWTEPEHEEIGITQSLPVQTELLRYRTLSDESSSDYMLQLDYETQLGEHSKLEIGTRAETRIISSDYSADQLNGEEWNPIPGFSNELDYYERIGAAYLQYAFEKDKFGLQAGLRGEITNVRVEDQLEASGDIKKNYAKIFPSISLSYTLTDEISSQLSYSRRTRRPSFWMLNTFGGISNPTSLFIGNPDINPIYIDRAEWNLLARWEKVTLNPAIYASSVDDFFKVVSRQQAENIFGLEDGMVISRPVNLGTEQNLGLEMTASYRPIEAVSLFGEFNYYGFRESGSFEGRDFAVTGSAWSFSTRALLNLPKDVRFQTRYRYAAPIRDAQSIQRANWQADFSLSKQWNDKYTVSVNARSGRFRDSATFTPNFTEDNFARWTGWRFGMNFQYRFEKGAKSGERRQRGSIR